MAGSPMAPVSNLGFPGGGGYDTSTEKGWLQTYYPDHADLQPGGKYGTPIGGYDPVTGSVGGAQPALGNTGGQPSILSPSDRAAGDWLRTYYPNHPDIQLNGKYYDPSTTGSISGGTGGGTDMNFGLPDIANIPTSGPGYKYGTGMGFGLPDINTEKGWLQVNYPNHPDLQPGGKYGGDSYPYGQGMGFGLGDPGFGSNPAGQMSNIDFGLGLPAAQTPITGMTEQEWERAFSPNAPDLQPGGKYYAGGGGSFADFGMGSTTGMNQDYAAGVAPTPGYSIQPGTAAATFGGGMTSQDAAAQAQTYNDLQNRLANEASFYAAQAAALPSSPQNYASQIVAPYDRNFGGQIQGYNPFSTQYQAY